MDKYLQAGNNKSSSRPTSCLEALKIAQITSNSKQKQTSSALTVLDLACERNRQQADTRNFVGWKSTQDGRKVYTTFRNQHKVTAEGSEGFRLALTDSKAKTKRKVKDLENNLDDAQSDMVQKSAPKRQKKAVTANNASTSNNNLHPSTNTISNDSLGSFFRK